MEGIAKSMIAIAIIALLFLTNPKITLIIGFSFIIIYGLIYKFSSGLLSRIGKQNLKSNELRYTAISEAFGAAKEVKVSGLEEVYIKRFSNPTKIFMQNHALSQVIALLPRFALEIMAFGGIMVMILIIMRQTGNINSVLPIISLYVFAGYRLMPAIQAIYSSFTRVVFVGPSLDKLCDDIKNLKTYNTKQEKGILSLNKKISLTNINYNYPNTSRTALKDINIDIIAKTTVGLVGVTGSGKTTTVDIILGLLEAQKGTLKIDDQIITSQNARSWQRSIGYVPQHIYLSDDTVAANIAFGVESVDINQEAVNKSAKIANLHEFVMNELPKQYQTTIGERGIRLSGGQRQRIGIARALYHNPQVLILDEATSALDNLTEQAVMDAVNNLGKNITIILIAHRLSTVKNCDRIFLLENGKIINEGTFEELIKINDNFRKSVSY
jgi:ABC-type multidrug transport system fused ATPase/permease subunit